MSIVVCFGNPAVAIGPGPGAAAETEAVITTGTVLVDIFILSGICINRVGIYRDGTVRIGARDGTARRIDSTGKSGNAFVGA